MKVKHVKYGLALILLGNICFGQQPDHFKKYGLFFEHKCKTIYSTSSNVGGLSYVFGENVNLRADSSLNGKVIEKLNVGDEVHILKYTQNYSSEIEGQREPWIMIKTSSGNIGFVYGALITKNYLKYDLNKNSIVELILLGGDFLNPLNAKLKILEEGRLLVNEKIDSLCIEKSCEQMVMMRILIDQKLFNKEIIEIGAGSNFCWSIWRSNYFYFLNDKISKILTKKITMNNTGNYDKVVFPSDFEGVDQNIIVMKCKSLRKDGALLHDCNILESYELIGKVFEIKND